MKRIIGGIYRHPNENNKEEFLTKLNATLTNITSNKKHAIFWAI